MVPSIDGGDDFVGVGGSDEGLGLRIVFCEVAVDRGLDVDDGMEDAALETPLGQPGEEALDGVEPRAEVGVKWKVKRVWRSSQTRTLGCL